MTGESQGPGSEERQRRLGEELHRLQEMHKASEGNKIMGRTYAHGISYRVFQGNHMELKSFLDHIAAPTVHAHMWDERHRYRIDYARDEVARLLHNYVSAVMSLVAASRNFVNGHYPNTGLSREYKRRVKQDFADNPLHIFLQDLRNYTHHYRLPSTKAVGSIRPREDGGTDFDNAFMLNVDRLREWDGWTSKARTYLDKLGSEADPRDLINAYEPLVRGLHEWLMGRIIEEHEEAIEELFDLERRMKRVERDWRISWGDREVPRDQEVPERSRELLNALYANKETRSDYATIDDVILTLYESISFPYGGMPNLDRFRSLFLPDAQVIEVESGATYLSNVSKYVADLHKGIHEGTITALTEAEVARRSFPLGDVAHVLSFHRTGYMENGTEKHSQGLYDLHLVKGKVEGRDRWAITSMHLCQGYGVTLVPSPGEAPDQAGVVGEAPPQGA